METFIDKGFNNDYLEATYIAIFAHLVVWATCLLFSEFVRRRRPLLLPGLVGTLVEPQHDGIPETFTVPIFADIMVERYVKSANAAKDSLLMIVIATLAIQTGYGATATTVILTWIFFVASICWALSILSYDQTWIPFILLSISLPFVLLIFVLSFQKDLDLFFQ